MNKLYCILLLFNVTEFDINNVHWLPYLVMIILIIFRKITEKYNYKAVPIAELRPGMILSMGSTMGFIGSKIDGLPLFSSEDLKSRLSAQEVESITRWSKSKYGKNTIVIVQKIPFAIFISIGTIVFTILEII